MSAAKRIGLLKAIADETRFKMAAALAEKPMCAEELAERLGRAASTVSFHLRKLEEAGLVAKSKVQYYLVYSLKEDLLGATLAELIGGGAAKKPAEDGAQNGFRRKVIDSFFENGRLLRMPRQLRKREVVLEEILAAFEPGRSYDEQRVDELIHLVADDHCTVRRMFVDQGLMTRRNGVYRLNRKERSPMTAKEEEKRIKREYKESPREAGVFRITNKDSGKVYLGSSLNLHGPLNKHRFTLKIGSHINRELQADYDRLGEAAFEFEIVDTVKRKDSPGFNAEDELEVLEALWIDKEEPFSERGYNNRKTIRE